MHHLFGGGAHHLGVFAHAVGVADHHAQGIVNAVVLGFHRQAHPHVDILQAGQGGIEQGVHLLEDGAYSLTVSDNGVGLPAGFDFRRSPSLGLQLVTMMSELMGGTVEMTRENGTAFTITFREYREAGTELH